MSMTIQSGLKAKILEAQGEASKDLKAPAEWLRGLERHFEKRDDGGIYFFNRVWISSVGGIRKLIMDEAHTSRYSVHPGMDKMYYDLKDLYWWPGMKRDIVEYVSKYLTTKHEYILSPETDGQSERTIQTLEDMGKLAPRYVGPFKIVECVGWVAYRLKLPQELSCIHDTFHVSNLKKYLAESDAQIPLEEIKIDESLRFVEEPIKIMERDMKKLKRRRIPLVKVH
nr:reverse transcriptase domain-containing protein [Tanacetum cinerariifolium]